MTKTIIINIIMNIIINNRVLGVSLPIKLPHKLLLKRWFLRSIFYHIHIMLTNHHRVEEVIYFCDINTSEWFLFYIVFAIYEL
jgi:hypothetical protein